MRVLAQSVVPSRDPYLHLGYLSASGRGVNAAVDRLGAFSALLTAGVALVLLGLVARRTIRTLGDMPSLPHRARNGARVRLGALLLSAVALALVAWRLVF